MGSAFTTTLRRFAAAPACRHLLVASAAALAVAAGIAFTTDAGTRLVVEIALLLTGGIGGLLAHEFAHALAYERFSPGSDWSVTVTGHTLSVVVEVPLDGWRRAVVASVGPATGAVASLVPMPWSTSNGVFWVLAATHLLLLTPLASDGRQLVAGLRRV